MRTVEVARVFEQLGLASLGTAEVSRYAAPSSFMYMEVCLGALAASLAAPSQGDVGDFPLGGDDSLARCHTLQRSDQHMRGEQAAGQGLGAPKRAETNLEPDTITGSAASSACEKG